jgi:hypothetical protein
MRGSSPRMTNRGYSTFRYTAGLDLVSSVPGFKCVVAGLDPATHRSSRDRFLQEAMDARVEARA